MDPSWECPVEATPHVLDTPRRVDSGNSEFPWLLSVPARPDLQYILGATTPRTGSQTRSQVHDQSGSVPHVQGMFGRTTPRTSPQTSSQINDQSWSFAWLLAELARTHDRELREAIARSSVPHLEPPRILAPEGCNFVFDAAQANGKIFSTRDQHAPVHVSLEKASLADSASCSTPPTILTPRYLESTLESPDAFPEDANQNVKCNGLKFSDEPSSPGPRPSMVFESTTLSFANKHQSKKEDDQSLFGRLTRLINRVEFEFAIASAILLNTFIMCCECQYVGLALGFDLKYPGRNVLAHKTWNGAETAFHFFDWFFGILFFLEMVVKLACLRIRYFYDSFTPSDCDHKDRKLAVTIFFQSLQGWNMLDFLCVSAFLCDKMASSSSVVNPQMIRLLRLFRLFRVVRLLRFLETLDHLYVMTTAISGLTKVLAWAITLLTTMLLACNLFLVKMLQVTYFHHVTANNLNPDQLKRHHEMYAYFGTCSRCMLSMFEITLGNWPPVARLLSEEVSEWFTFICLVHKLTIGFAVIGVITGVILQETFKVAQTDDIIMLRQKQKQTNILKKKMDSLFKTLDSEGDGKLTVSEFTFIGEDPDIKLWLASLDIETDDLETLFELIDIDDNGSITTDELFARMPRIKGAARGIDMLALRKALDKGAYDKGSWTRAKMNRAASL